MREQPIVWTRTLFRELASQFNHKHPSLWADVLATPDMNGSTLTFYRRLHTQGVRQFEPLHRIILTRDGGRVWVVEPYGVPLYEEEDVAIKELLEG